MLVHSRQLPPFTTKRRGNGHNGGESRGSWTNACRCERTGETGANASWQHETHSINDDTVRDAKLNQPRDSAHAGNSDTVANSESGTNANSESGTNANSESGTESESSAKPEPEPNRQPDAGA